MNKTTENSFGIIKFGNESWLKNIREGKMWFRTLEYYQEYEANDNIGDRFEGLTHIYYPEKNTQIRFYQSSMENNFNDLSNTPIFLIPKYNKTVFIFCLSYISVKDIENKTIYDDSILLQKDWDSVFFFLDPVKFLNLIKNSLKKYNPKIGKIEYRDFAKNQEDLTCFTKSDKYKHQKEVRIVINYFGEKDKKITHIDDNTIELNISDKIDGFIIPINTFREGFKVIKKGRKNIKNG